jgi:hypothetical protein
MKSPLAHLAAAVTFLVTISMPALAESPKIEHVVKLLHEAKDSDHPLPLLEKAHKMLKEFHPSHPLAMTAAGVGRRRSAAIQIGENEKKQHAMEAIAKAIETAKQGGDAKPKIESAIAFTHSAG